ncbi:membrane protein insertase YidC, partial [Francisella tularensis subsp. holarctica]|uniref:membrane protein insertase YidC n=1 Tax=Francisella tularensis TaxID=263 RepID=UPI002381B92E
RKVSFKDISKTNVHPTLINSDGQGWVAFFQHYFVSAWIPQSTNAKIFYKNLNGDVFEAGAFTGASIAQNQSVNISSILY